MNLILDLHNHTVECGHAFSTVWEIVKMAKERGLKLVAITEHTSLVELGFFRVLKRLPDFAEGVEIIDGGETDIRDFDGTLSMDDENLKKLTFVIASLHKEEMKPGTKEENTRALVNAIRNKNINMLGHINDSRFEVDYDVVCKKAKEEGVIIEINNQTLQKINKEENEENIKELIDVCLKYKCYISMSSDSHNPWAVGDFSLVKPLVEKVNYPEELIVNTSVELLKNIIRDRRNRI